MPSARAVEANRAANAHLVTLVERDLLAFWRRLPLDQPEVARDRLLTYVPTLVTQYGQVAGTIAADFYDQARAESLPRTAPRYRAKVAPPVDKAATVGTVRRLSGYLFTPEPVAMLPGLLSKTSEYALQPGRDTIADNTARDPAHASWARVPSGVGTCSFCLMLASRGAVYGSAGSAGAKGQGSVFHGHCDCVATPIWTPSDLPAGYDPAELEAAWRASV